MLALPDGVVGKLQAVPIRMIIGTRSAGGILLRQFRADLQLRDVVHDDVVDAEQQRVMAFAQAHNLAARDMLFDPGDAASAAS